MPEKMTSQIPLNIQNSTPITCEKCGNDTFILVFYLRKFSKLLTGSANDVLYPHEAFACSKCHHVNEQFRLPEENKQDKKPESPIISLP